MDNHYYGFPTYLKELSDSENKILKRETVKAVNHTYGDTIQKVKYLDYRHKRQLQRERELSKQKKEQERIRLEKAKSRAAVYKSAKRYGGNFIGIVPLLIVITFVWFIAGTYTQVTKSVTVGDHTYEYEMVTPESANAIGGRAIDFVSELMISLGNIGNEMKGMFVNDNGALATGLLDFFNASIDIVFQSFSLLTKLTLYLNDMLKDKYADYTQAEVALLVQWERDNGYMSYWRFQWLQLKFYFDFNGIDDIYEIWDFNENNPHLHENQVPEEE
ncbi:MAG: hypothetical protein QXI16_03915 [Sulfolobaceae archaeon]